MLNIKEIKNKIKMTISMDELNGRHNDLCTMLSSDARVFKNFVSKYKYVEFDTINQVNYLDESLIDAYGEDNICTVVDYKLALEELLKEYNGYKEG